MAQLGNIDFTLSHISSHFVIVSQIYHILICCWASVYWVKPANERYTQYTEDRDRENMNIISSSRLLDNLFLDNLDIFYLNYFLWEISYADFIWILIWIVMYLKCSFHFYDLILLRTFQISIFYICNVDVIDLLRSWHISNWLLFW